MYPPSTSTATKATAITTCLTTVDDFKQLGRRLTIVISLTTATKSTTTINATTRSSTFLLQIRGQVDDESKIDLGSNLKRLSCSK